ARSWPSTRPWSTSPWSTRSLRRKPTPVPELPEVETLRRDLDKEVVGRRIKSVLVDGERTIRRHPDNADFVARLEGHKIVGVERRGKYLLLRLEGGDVL